jgi:hypothetical protein
MRIQTGILGVAAALFVASPAVAAQQVYTLSGTISNEFQFSAPIPQWKFATGQAFTAKLTYDAARVTSTVNYLTTPDWNLQFHYSPMVALEITIDTPGGPYRYSVPTLDLTGSAWQYAAVGSGAGGWNGIDMRWQNYPVGWTANPPSVALPPSAYVGGYNPHSAFLSLYGPTTGVIANPAFVPSDLTSVFNAVGPGGSRSLDIRFSDSFGWTPGVERIDGIVNMRIDRLTLAAVPESSTWMMMIAGFGFVGAGLRRRAARKRLSPRAA